MVYVDDTQERYRGKVLCYMVADTEAEMHAMAQLIGVRRRWCRTDLYGPLYRICRAMKARAIRNGAKEVTQREFVQIVRRSKREQV